MTAPLAAPTGGRPALHEGKRVRTVTGAPGRAAGSDSWREIRRDLITWLVLSDIAAVISPGLVLMAASPRLGGIVLGAGGLMLVLSWAGGSLHVDVVELNSELPVLRKLLGMYKLQKEDIQTAVLNLSKSGNTEFRANLIVYTSEKIISLSIGIYTKG